jgi:hypothetical protein
MSGGALRGPYANPHEAVGAATKYQGPKAKKRSKISFNAMVKSPSIASWT